MGTTPTTIGTESRIFTGVFDDREKIKAGTSMLSFFSRNTPIISLFAEDFDDSVIRGNKRIAALVPREGEITRHLGTTIPTQVPGPFSKFSRRFPLGLDYTSVSEVQLRKMTPEEMPYDPWSKQKRAQYYLTNSMMDMYRRFADMDNLLASQSMRLGKQDAIIGTSNTNEQYDWRRATANTITVGTAWTTTSADAIGDIDSACVRVDRYGYAKPDICCMGTAAYDAFRKNDTIKAEGDNRRYETVNIEGGFNAPPDHSFLTENGWILRGRLVTPKGYEMFIYTTMDFYDDGSGNKIDIMPTSSVFVTSSAADFDRFYGPSITLDLTPTQKMWWMERLGINVDAVSPGGRVPSGVLPRDSVFLWGDETMNSIDIWFQHAPVFKTTQTDAIATLSGVI